MFTFGVFLCTIQGINPHDQLHLRKKCMQGNKRKFPVYSYRAKLQGRRFQARNCYLTSSSLSSLYSSGHILWRISSECPFSMRSLLISSEESSWEQEIKQNHIKIISHWVFFFFFSTKQNEARVKLTSSPMMVILGNFWASEAQILCCASLSASVCRSFAPVCAQGKIHSPQQSRSVHQANGPEAQCLTFSTIPSSPVWRTFLTIAPAFAATL